MADHDDLRRTIAALRTEVPMRPEWRTEVLRGIATLATPGSSRPGAAPSRGGWTIRPSVAIAAGLLCAIIGGTVTLGSARLARAHRDRPSATAPHGTPVRFVLVAPAASRVAIVGDFNGWSPDATPLHRTATGLWSIDISLRAGRHTYAFVVDGTVVADPNALDSADDDFGVRSSVVLVSEHPST